MLAHDDEGFSALLDVFAFVFAFAGLAFAELTFAELTFAELAFADFDIYGIYDTVDVTLGEF